MKTTRLLSLVLFLFTAMLVGSIDLLAQCTGADEYGHLMFFDDGSGDENYEINQFCSWSFESRIGGICKIGFFDFHTETDFDFVRIYDGPDANAPLLAELSGNIVPEIYLTTQPFVFIEWNSDAIESRPGFSGFVDSYTAQLTSCNGSISDGIGDYPNNINEFSSSNFSWLINPPGAEEITFDFESIAIEPFYDWIRIYDGTDNSGIFLGEYGGFTPQTGIVATSGSMFVEMSTDGSEVFEGFVASYSCTFCSNSETTVLTAPEGAISDGSGENDYANNTDCTWLIQPEGADFINIELGSFSTESCCDFISIYDGNSIFAQPLAFLSGSSPGGLSYLTTGGSAFIRFDSDVSQTSEGFTLEYTSGNSLSVDDPELPIEVGAFPNPTNDIVKLELLTNGASNLTLQLFDLQGRQVHLEQNQVYVNGSAEHSIDLSGHGTGSYVLQIIDDEGNSSHLKLIKAE
ncbi:MAG: CUB domain-containing protein [Bacteroidota bacterium]